MGVGKRQHNEPSQCDARYIFQSSGNDGKVGERGNEYRDLRGNSIFCGESPRNHYLVLWGRGDLAN